MHAPAELPVQVQDYQTPGPQKIVTYLYDTKNLLLSLDALSPATAALVGQVNSSGCWHTR
jgi:hypothetical protein